jgi:hypothetical protein
MEIEWKYDRNTIEINRACLRKAGKLGEIHQIRNSTYFTERSEVYFHHISFLLFHGACLPPLDLQNGIILRAAIVINNEGGPGGD